MDREGALIILLRYFFQRLLWIGDHPKKATPIWLLPTIYMSTKNLLIYTSMLLAAGLGGCESCTCPPSVKLGTTSVRSRSYIPYKPGELISFVNSTGGLLTLKDTLDEVKSEQMIQASQCAKPPLSSSFYYYEVANVRRASLKPVTPIALVGLNTAAFTFQHFVYNEQGPVQDTLFIDALIVDNNAGGGSLRIATNERGNRPRLSANTVNNYIGYRLIADTVLNGAAYQKLYVDPRRPTTYYSVALGIVAFRDNKEWWYLKK
jgi:hypothetical protein